MVFEIYADKNVCTLGYVEGNVCIWDKNGNVIYNGFGDIVIDKECIIMARSDTDNNCNIT